MNMFDNYGNLLPYEQFMQIHNFPVHFKEFNSVSKAIPLTLIHLVKGHVLYNSKVTIKPKLILNGLLLTDKKAITNISALYISKSK